MNEVKVCVSSRVVTAIAFGIIFAVFSFVNELIEIIGIWIWKYKCLLLSSFQTIFCVCVCVGGGGYKENPFDQEI